MQNVKSRTAEPRVKSVELSKRAMTLGEAGLIKFLDAQLQNAAEGPFSRNEDVDLVSPKWVHYHTFADTLLYIEN